MGNRREMNVRATHMCVGMGNDKGVDGNEKWETATGVGMRVWMGMRNGKWPRVWEMLYGGIGMGME
jgi:hypothetical protein